MEYLQEVEKEMSREALWKPAVASSLEARLGGFARTGTAHCRQGFQLHERDGTAAFISVFCLFLSVETGKPW